jgi:hypothetical protein
VLLIPSNLFISFPFLLTSPFALALGLRLWIWTAANSKRSCPSALFLSSSSSTCLLVCLFARSSESLVQPPALDWPGLTYPNWHDPRAGRVKSIINPPPCQSSRLLGPVNLPSTPPQTLVAHFRERSEPLHCFFSPLHWLGCFPGFAAARSALNFVSSIAPARAFLAVRATRQRRRSHPREAQLCPTRQRKLDASNLGSLSLDRRHHGIFPHLR